MKRSFKTNITILRILSVSLVLLSLISCNQTNPQPTPAPTPAPQPGSVLIKWNLIIDGQTHTWQGYYPDCSTAASGGSQYTLQTTGVGQLTFAKSTAEFFTINIAKPGMSTTGSYTINQANYNSDCMFSIMDLNNSINVNTAYGGSVTVNITTLPSVSVALNGVTSNGNVIGTFSGTIGKSTGGTSTISGSFESIRIQ